MNTIRRVATIVGIALSVCSSCWGQAGLTTGAIRGAIVDNQGAVIPGVKVMVTNVSLNSSQEYTTQSDGIFVAPLLQPAADYQIEIQHAGFEHVLIKGVNVRVSEVTNIRIPLGVRGPQEMILVSGEVEGVQVSSPALGGVLGPKVISSLPLNTRNPLQLLGTDAGVVALPGATLFFVAGSRATFNNYILNGADANNFMWNSLTAVATPNPDAVQEFRTATSLYDATMGRGAGANITLVTRSGTNDVHGNVYWFNRGSALAANDFFLNRLGRPKPFLLRNHFGGSAGGPLPGKKTLWFVNYEGARQITPVTQTGTLPVLPATRDAASLANAFSLPVSAIDPVAVRILNLPGPYDGHLVPSGQGSVGTLGNFAFASSAPLVEDQLSVRLDHNLTIAGQSNRLSFTMFLNRSDTTTKIGDRPGSSGLGAGTVAAVRNRVFSLIDTHTFGPRVTNELTLGVNLIHNDDDSFSNAAKLGDIGMSRFNQSIIAWIPTFTFSDQLAFGTSTNSGAIQHSSSGTLRDIVFYSKGTHNLRFGGEVRLYQLNRESPFAQAGQLSFTRQFANAAHGTPAAANANLSFRDFLIGAPVSHFIRSGNSVGNFRSHDIVGFVQDDFRVTPNLTLNLGLRYDFLSHVREKNHALVNFDLSLVPASARALGGPGLLQGLVFPEGLSGFGTPGVPDSGMNGENWTNFAPRVGFAWDVLGNSKIAARGGYGVYFIRISALPALQLISQPPLGLTSSITGFRGAGILNNPFPTLPLPQDFPVLPPAPTLTGYNTNGSPIFTAPLLSFGVFDRNMRTPYVQQWNLTVQYALGSKWVAEVGYLGTHGVRLLANSGPNDALLRNSSNPGPLGLETNSSANRDARVPVVGIGAGGINLFDNQGKSTYNAVIATVTHQSPSGLFLKAAYTFSKTIDNGFVQGGFDIGNLTGNQFFPQFDKGPANFHSPHRLVMTYLYELPSPRDGLLKKIFGGWSVSGLTTYMSGFPILYTQSIGDTSLSAAAGRPNVVPGCQLINPGSVTSNLDNYLNPACVSVTPLLPAGTQFGGLSPYATPGDQLYRISSNGSGRLQGGMGRNIGQGPMQSRWDAAISKRVVITERFNVEFRSEFFNLPNHPSFNRPNSTVGSSAFGRITSTSSIPRQIQFGIKINY